MELFEILLVLAVGIIAGFLNTVGGGGSLLSMPILIFMGLPSAVANGTNRIALTVQNIVAVTNFRHKGFFDWQFNLLLAIPAVIGSLVGADLAISLPDEVFNKILAVVMLIVLALILRPPRSKATDRMAEPPLKSKIIAGIVFFFVGIYGGFIQAGVGFIIIAALNLITGWSLVKINSVKVFVILAYMLSSLAVFVANGQVEWLLGLTLAVGNGTGGWLGSNFAVAKGDKWIRIILVITVTAMAARLLGLFELMGLNF